MRACVHCAPLRAYFRPVGHTYMLPHGLTHSPVETSTSISAFIARSFTHERAGCHTQAAARSLDPIHTSDALRARCVHTHSHACEDNCLTDDLSINAWSEVKSRFVVATHLSIAAHVHKRGKTNTNKNSCTSFGRMAISSNANKIFCILLNICYFLLNTYLKNNTRDSLLILL